MGAPWVCKAHSSLPIQVVVFMCADSSLPNSFWNVSAQHHRTWRPCVRQARAVGVPWLCRVGSRLPQLSSCLS